MRVNVVTVEEKVNLQVLLPAGDYCITCLPNKTGPKVLRRSVPQIWCVVLEPFLFLTEGNGKSFSKVIVENVLKEDRCLSVVSFVMAESQVSLQDISPMLSACNPSALLTLKGLGSSLVELSVHFDFLFSPAFPNRSEFLDICKRSGGVELCLCKSAKLWTQESGPLFIYKERLEHTGLINKARATISLPGGVALVV